MRKALSIAVLALAFVCQMAYVISSAAVSSLFDRELVLSLLDHPEIQAGIVRRILAAVDLPEDDKELLAGTLSQILSRETFKSAVVRSLPALRSYMTSYGRSPSEVELEIEGLKRELAEALELSDPDLVALVKSEVPDRIDVSDYLYALLPRQAFQACRFAETLPRTAAVLAAALYLLSLLITGFHRRALQRVSLTAASSSVLSAVAGWFCIPHVRVLLALRLLSSLPVPGSFSGFLVETMSRLPHRPVVGTAGWIFAGSCLVYAAASYSFSGKRCMRKDVASATVAHLRMDVSRFSLARWMEERVRRLKAQADEFETVRLSPERRNRTEKLRRVSLASHGVIFLLLTASIPLFFRPEAVRPLSSYAQPLLGSLASYRGPLGFSGDRAYAYLLKFVRDNPNRKAGTAAGDRSALWIRDAFSSMGLASDVQKFAFATRAPAAAVREISLFRLKVSDLIVPGSGLNVVAVSPGKVRDAIVIGAHRDTAGRYEGAEDNASGTATLLELARALSSGEHFYTYVFASFDAEEAGLKGSQAFLRMNQALPVRLAVILDMTGLAGADTLGFYPAVSRWGQSPLWTLALGVKVATSPPFGFTPVFWDMMQPATDSSVLLYWFARSKNVHGRIPTDSEPFVNEGIPAIGVLAARTGMPGEPLHGRAIHSFEDTVEQVSAETLALVGRFVEAYLRTLDGAAESIGAVSDHSGADPTSLFRSGALRSGGYVLAEDGVLPPMYVRGFAIYQILLAFIAVAVTFCASDVRPILVGAFFVTEIPWLLAVALLAGLSTAVPVFLGSTLALNLPFLFVHATWFVVSAGGIALLVILRSRFLEREKMSASWMAAYQKVLLTCFSWLLLAVGFLVTNPFVAIETALLPLYFFSRIDYERDDIRLLWRFALAMWLASKFIGSGTHLKTFIPGVPASEYVLFFIQTLTWMLTALYVASFPPRNARTVMAPAGNTTREPTRV